MDADNPTGDVVSGDVVSGGRDDGHRSRRWPVVLAALAVVATVLGRQGDAQLRGAEFRELLGCATTAQQSVVDADARVSAMSSYVSPALNADVTDAVRRGLRGLVRDAAAAGSRDVAAAAAPCRRFSPVRWHRSLARAREGYVAYLSAEQRRLEATARDDRELVREQPGLDLARARARAALSGGATGAIARARVTALLADPG